jgi:hypothetical protein
MRCRYGDGMARFITLQSQGKQALLFCKKEAKNFYLLPSKPFNRRGTRTSLGRRRTKLTKVFWFFFSKKNALLANVPFPPPTLCAVILT